MKTRRSRVANNASPPKKKMTPLARVICFLTTGAVAGFIAAITIAVVFIAGFTFAQISERLDAPLKKAGISNVERAHAALASQVAYLAEVKDLQTVGVAADGRVEALLAQRSLEIERLQIEAAALRGRNDAAALKSFQVLRARISELPNMALQITLALLTGKAGIAIGAFLLFYWVFIFLMSGPFLARMSKRFDKLCWKLTPAHA